MRRTPRGLRRVAVGAGLTTLVLSTGPAGPAASVYPPTAFGPEGMTVQRGEPLASAPTADGRTRAGVLCRRLPPRFHVHVHLAIYVDGRLRPVPATIGLAGPTAHPRETGPMYFARTCYYDVHTHAQDGVIHVEAPAPQTFTLGDFFGVWGQPLGPGRVGPAVGPLTVYVDGRAVTGDPNALVLHSREEIQLDLGAVVPPQPVNWSHF